VRAGGGGNGRFGVEAVSTGVIGYVEVRGSVCEGDNRGGETTGAWRLRGEGTFVDFFAWETRLGARGGDSSHNSDVQLSAGLKRRFSIVFDVWREAAVEDGRREGTSISYSLSQFSTCFRLDDRLGAELGREDGRVGSEGVETLGDMMANMKV